MITAQQRDNVLRVVRYMERRNPHRLFSSSLDHLKTPRQWAKHARAWLKQQTIAV